MLILLYREGVNHSLATSNHLTSVNTNRYICCQQGRLLLLPRAGRVSGHLLDRLQSILNAAARLVFSARRSERIIRFSATFIGCGSRIQFRLCVLAFRCLNGSAPQYLVESVRRTADVEGRRHFRSSTTMTLVVPSVQRSTLGDRAFPVAASRAWNSLPPAIRTVSSFTSFRQQLKTHLFRLSFC